MSKRLGSSQSESSTSQIRLGFKNYLLSNNDSKSLICKFGPQAIALWQNNHESAEIEQKLNLPAGFVRNKVVPAFCSYLKAHHSFSKLL